MAAKTLSSYLPRFLRRLASCSSTMLSLQLDTCFHHIHGFRFPHGRRSIEIVSRSQRPM